MEKNKTKYLEARLKANRNYYAKNKEKIQLQNKFRSAKMFINDTEDVEKLKILVELIENKIKLLEK